MESSKLIEEINVLDPQNINSEMVSKLIDVFKRTSDFKLIDTIALKFADIDSKIVLKALINKLDEVKTSNHTSTLIYACSEHDCSEYLHFFIDLLLCSDYHGMIESFSVIEAMKGPIKLSDKIIAENKISRYISLNNIDKEKQEYLKKTIAIIDEIEIER